MTIVLIVIHHEASGLVHPEQSTHADLAMQLYHKTLSKTCRASDVLFEESRAYEVVNVRQ